MGKSRKQVPAALHAELTEYASLLRALRTSSTLDLASHLTRPPSKRQKLSEPDPTDSDDELDELEDEQHGAERSVAGIEDATSEPVLGRSISIPSGPHPDVGPSSNATAPSVTDTQDIEGSYAKESTKGKGKAKSKDRDTWTRWPLMAGDVHVPEWSLEDEVKVLALDAIREHREHAPMTTYAAETDAPVPSKCEGSHEQAPDTESASDSEEDEEDIVPSSVYFSASAHLQHLLAIAAAHFPLITPSMQNRQAPIGWQSVLIAAGAGGMVSPETIERAKRRLEAIYQPDELKALSLVRPQSALKRKLSDLYKSDDMEFSFLTLPGQSARGEQAIGVPAGSKAPRKRGPYKKRMKSEPNDDDPASVEEMAILEGRDQVAPPED